LDFKGFLGFSFQKPYKNLGFFAANFEPCAEAVYVRHHCLWCEGLTVQRCSEWSSGTVVTISQVSTWASCDTVVYT